MREIDAQLITENVKQACIEACCVLPDDVLEALKQSREIEESPAGKDVIEQLIENADIARTRQMPICQDTGFALVFVELGQDAHIAGGDLYEAINEGVRQGYEEGYLRKSIVRHPLDRKNTGDNTPAVIHVESCRGIGSSHDSAQGRRKREHERGEDAHPCRRIRGREAIHRGRSEERGLQPLPADYRRRRAGRHAGEGGSSIEKAMLRQRWAAECESA